MRGPAAVVLALAAMLVAVPSAVAGWWRPPQRLTWYWQLQGAVKNDKAVDAYDIDGFENDAGEVALLHGQGKCAQKGFDAVEPDNMEAYANASGFPLTASEQLAYNEWVAQTVHALGMAVLQKNDGEQTQQQVKDFDGALAEQCNQYHECSDYMLYMQAGKPVLNAEYRLGKSRFCVADESSGIMGARLNLALNGRRFEPCW